MKTVLRPILFLVLLVLAGCKSVDRLLVGDDPTPPPTSGSTQNLPGCGMSKMLVCRDGQ